MKKLLQILAIVVTALFVLSIIFTLYRYWGVKTGRLVRMDNGTYLTQQEFHSIYPPQNTVLPDKNKPEEVYTKFREAIMAGNVDEALKYVAERKRGEYRVSLVKNLELYKTLPEFSNLEVAKDYSGVQAGFNFTQNNQAYSVMLEKTWDGYWFIYGI